MKTIYLDNTATTRTRKEVAVVINRYFKRKYGNPSSAHRTGLIAKGSLEMARERVAQALNCSSGEIVFTSSGSEANNLAIKGVSQTQGRSLRIITSPIEHSSILMTCRMLEVDGQKVVYLQVDGQGRYDLDQLQKEMTGEPTLVSLSYVNNEIGTVQDVDRIVAIAKARGALLHLDAVQALPYFDIDMARLGADLVSFSGHKLYAPKGVGLLYIREGTPLQPLISGGEQEFGLRSGTENVAYIVGLSKAVILNQREKKKYVQTLVPMRDRLIEGILKNVPDSMLTGDPRRRAPNSASFCFKGINGKMLVRQLSWRGIEVSSGSACSSPKNEPSHVLAACRISEDYLPGSLRVTLGRDNTPKDVEHILDVLPGIVNQMRKGDIPLQNASIFLSQEEFRKKQSRGESLQVLDVRLLNYPKFRIPGSVALPFWKLKKNLSRLDRHKETVVVCHQGDVLAPEAHQILIMNGFSNVQVLKGGLAGYMEMDRLPGFVLKYN